VSRFSPTPASAPGVSTAGNQNAHKHGANGVARIRPAARAQKRRFLRQAGLRASDLDGVALALLDNWGRAQAKVQLLDAYFDEHGFLDERGEPRPPAKVYFTALNSARLAATRLKEHLRERSGDPVKQLADYIDAEYAQPDAGGG
jgi:hypothetical protein